MEYWCICLYLGMNNRNDAQVPFQLIVTEQVSDVQRDEMHFRPNLLVLIVSLLSNQTTNDKQKEFHNGRNLQYPEAALILSNCTLC